MGNLNVTRQKLMQCTLPCSSHRQVPQERSRFRSFGAAARSGLLLRCLLLLVPLVLLITFILQKSINPFTVFPKDWRRVLSEGLYLSGQDPKLPFGPSAGSCSPLPVCANNHFSFFIQSGAANVVGPKICVENKLVMGTALNNVGIGINVVTVDGRTGKVTRSSSFNMYSGDVEPLIQFLKGLEVGAVVLMASYDEPSSKLNDEVRRLIGDLGSTAVQVLGYRDSWVFVGGKGATVKSSFEKHLKNDKDTNKYEGWPEVIQLHGCVPVFPQEPAVATENQQVKV